MKLALRISYFGDGFFGSQMQPGLRTVEGEFIAACRRLDLFKDWRKAGFSTAGRTDRGVHARCQVCSFSTDEPERAIRSLNRVLPEDIWCAAWAEVPEGFHPRYSAVSRTYRYYLVPGDTALMHEAAEEFIGRHDFSAFARPAGRDPVRKVFSARVFESGQFTVFEVVGASFLWNMVRGMATAIERVGRGRISPGDIAGLLTEPPGQRLPAAPPEGLVLWDIDYGVPLIPLPADEGIRRCHARRRYHVLMAEVSIRLASEGEPDGGSQYLK